MNNQVSENETTPKLPEYINGFKLTSIGRAFSNKHLELIILPTEKCNFRCVYCYEDFAIGKMKPSVVNGVKNFLANRMPNLDSLAISWFGGEPLLAKDVVLDIARYAKRLSDVHGVKYRGGFTTNASLLTTDLIKQFSDANHLDYQITLDGDRDTHNTTRVLANGKGTFDQIWTNLLNAARTDVAFQIKLRIHITPYNEVAVEKLLRDVEKCLGADERFSIFFHQVSNLGGPNAEKIESLSKARYGAIVERLKQSSSIFSKRVSSESDLSSNGYICYAAKPNSFLIRSNGRVGKCTVALDDERNDIGTITDDGRLIIENKKLRVWMNGFETIDPARLGCPLSMLSAPRESRVPRTKQIAAIVTSG